MVGRFFIFAIMIGALLGLLAGLLVPIVKTFDDGGGDGTTSVAAPLSQVLAPQAAMPPSRRAPPPSPPSSRSRTPPPSAASARALPPMPPTRYSHGAVTLERAADSHFYANVILDGANVRMLVDSGASRVVLSRRDAERIGLDYHSLPDSGYASTAGGIIPVRRAHIRRMAIHNLEAHDVDVMVIDQDVAISLLGQDYLSRLSEITVKGDYMTLRR